jgi:hypothetical protein
MKSTSELPILSGLLLSFPLLVVAGRADFLFSLPRNNMDAIIAGVVFSLFTLPFFLLGYYLSKEKVFAKHWFILIWVSFGFYPFIWVSRLLYSVLIVVLMFLGLTPPARTPQAEAWYREHRNIFDWIIIIFSILSLLVGVSQAKLVIAGILTIICLDFVLRGRNSFQYLVSYTIVWTLANVNAGGAIGMWGVIFLALGILFGIIVFVMLHRAQGEATRLDLREIDSNPAEDQL